MGKFLHTVLGYDSAPAMAQIASYWAYIVIVLGAYVLLPAGRPPRISPVRAPEGEQADTNDQLITT
jgi:high-affinity Fe2+/Pb2+ permease